MSALEDVLITVILGLGILLTGALLLVPWVIGLVASIEWLFRVVWP